MTRRTRRTHTTVLGDYTGSPLQDGRHVISYRVTEVENGVQNVKNSPDGVLAYSEGEFLA